jgi:hypothetical protein
VPNTNGGAVQQALNLLPAQLQQPVGQIITSVLNSTPQTQWIVSGQNPNGVTPFNIPSTQPAPAAGHSKVGTVLMVAAAVGVGYLIFKGK